MYLHYYVYAYLRKDGTPYYIGKGAGKRAWVKGSNDAISPPIDQSQIIIVERNLTDIGALAIERQLIRWYGRKDLGTGILRNKTDGGDGAAGAVRSEAHKKAKSEAFKGRATPWNNIPITLPNGQTYASKKEAYEKTGLSKYKIEWWLQVGGTTPPEGHRPYKPGHYINGAKTNCIPITTPDGKTYSSINEAVLQTGITKGKLIEWVKVGGDIPPRYVRTPDGRLHASITAAATAYNSSRSCIAYWLEHGGKCPPTRVPFPKSWHKSHALPRKKRCKNTTNLNLQNG